MNIADWQHLAFKTLNPLPFVLSVILLLSSLFRGCFRCIFSSVLGRGFAWSFGRGGSFGARFLFFLFLNVLGIKDEKFVDHLDQGEGALLITSSSCPQPEHLKTAVTSSKGVIAASRFSH